ncbi:MAG: lipoprotein-releasing ABC transporter ATP-binding protein LolD [Gammaproteobacteria bacterium]|nr:lipoprotein-releasing ABC transporter ATP-binding protein LolD [Gammaproteobacteria bacterium]
MSIIECVDVSKTYSEGKLTVDVLRDINFSVGVGEQVAVVGASGSGKSTLLHLLGGLADPTEGRIMIDGQDINQLSQSARGELRNSALGFVYQFHHLLPEFTALENVAMPLWIRRMDSNDAITLAEDMLAKVGLEKRMGHKPGELSGGERQRAAIARALVAKPKCIMADEPTGNLDTKTAESIHQLMLSLNTEFKTSLIVVTHDMNLARKMERIVGIENGRIVNKSDN